MAKSKQVLLKRSNVKGKVPALSAMTHGEMFLNYNDGVLMSKSSSNAVLKWSDDSKMATKNELNLKLDKIEAEGSYVKNADFQYLVSEIEDNERVITTAFEKFRESAGFNENGESTLGKSLTEAISELDGVKALANKVTVDGDTVKITTLSANTFSANTVKVGSLSANTFSANTAKVGSLSANTFSANTAKVGSLSANTFSAATIKTTNLSATTVSAHTIKSLTMSANTISGNTIRAAAISANTFSANTVKIGSLSASTIKSITTDDLRKDIDILSGDTYILDIGDAEFGSVISKTLSSDEINKIESAKDIIVRLLDDSGTALLNFRVTYFGNDSGNIMLVASSTVPINYSDDEHDSMQGYTVTIGMQISIEKESNILMAQMGYVTNQDYSNIINDISKSFLTINLGDYEGYSDENGNYIIVNFDFEGRLSNCVGAKVVLPNQIEAYLTSKTTHRPVNEAPYHVYEFSCLRVGRIDNKCDYLYGDIIKLTSTSYTNKIYVDWRGQINIGDHALDSYSAVTSYSAITATSAKTSNAAVTSTKWSTGRKITLSGDATGNVTLDGSQNVTLNVNVLSADTVPASGVKGVLSSDNMPTTINKAIRYTAKQHFGGDIHVCGEDGTSGGAIYFGDYDNYHDLESGGNSLVYIREEDDDTLDIFGREGVRIGYLVSNDSESYDENYAIVVDGGGSVIINGLVGYATSDEVDENNEILTKALNRLNTSAGFNSLGESTLPSGMSLTKAILELQKGGGTSDKVNVTESSSKSYIVSRETTDSDETSLHYDSAIWSENGQLYASSDKNLKEHVGNVDGNPELIKRIPKVFYHWKDDEQKRVQMGTYAQDIEKVYPEVVSRDDNGNLAVGYDRLSVIALAGIDELYKMIQDLKEENKQLRKELDSLKK